MQINRSRFNPLGCAKKWERIEMDVTHFNRAPYLTMIECGPSRFAIWLKLKSEEAKQVALVLDEIFHVRGPVSELLLDNSPCFRSQWIKEVCEKWSVILIFRFAYRPFGNGIIERNHRTIKRSAARAKPANQVFNCEWKFLNQIPTERRRSANWLRTANKCI